MMEGLERPMKRLKSGHEENEGGEFHAWEERNPVNQGPELTAETNQDGNGSSREDAMPLPEETAPVVADSSSRSNGDPPLSKNQQKKLRKKQEWEAQREDRKVIRKEKIAAKRERKKAEKRKLIEENGGQDPTPEPREPPPKAVTLPVTIMIDCDFDHLMRDNERISLASQITRCYSDNRRSTCRAHLAISSFGGKLKDRFDTILTHHKGWKGVRWLSEDFVDTAEKAREWMTPAESTDQFAGVFSRLQHLDDAAVAKLKAEGEVVYLSSESNETLTDLKPYSTYIIGGLVDKNREKGICHKRASERGVRTARLPIGEFMEMQSRKVLATNHVNEIMVRWLECGDWAEAFLKVIPKRKGGKLKGPDDGTVVDDQDDETIKETVPEVEDEAPERASATEGAVQGQT